MPDIAGSHNGSQVFCNLVLLAVEQFQESFDPQRLSRVANMQVVKALIDTGAQGTSITPAAAQRLGLTPVGAFPVQGVGGRRLHNYYLFKVGFVDFRQNEFGGSDPQFHLGSGPIKLLAL